jgi:hypothetical protein
MRYPETKIKEAILHPDPEIRDRATRYFAKASPPDPTIMPLVIQAVETYGRKDAIHLIGASQDLPQTEDTIAWVIAELNHEQTGQDTDYAYNLSRALLHADPALLLPKEEAVLQARQFLPDMRGAFTERLRMASWDAATCWQKLEEFCEKNKDKEQTKEIKLDHAERIVDALARFGNASEEKVRAILSEKIEDYSHSPMKWLEPLAVRLAGEARLESTIPLLIVKLGQDVDDLLNEDCAKALTRIGTEAVIESVTEAFPRGDDSFRIYAVQPLEYIHSDPAVEKTLALLRQEKELNMQQILAQALLSQFAHEGIEATRQLLIGRGLDFEGKGLRNYLVETCTITGERFPEYEEWRATEKKEKEEHWKRVKELEGDPRGLLVYALEKITGQKASDVVKAKPPVAPAPRMSLPHKLEAKVKVGRNDPCPCSSGKKFKNCCMRKQGEF